MTPFVLIASHGMLGRATAELFAHHALPFTPVNFPEVDIANAEHVARVIHPGVRYVINCAAWTDVDGAEANEAAADGANATGVANLAKRCKEVGALLVTYSTDYVFPGVATTPYRTDASREPLNAYGRSKARGEEALERSGARFLNIRTSWLYAPWGKNFVRTMAGLLRTKPSLKVVDDQRGRPTSAEHLAAMTLRLIDVGAETGHWHVTDGGECTWCEFAREIGRLTGAPGVVEACGSDQFPRPAKRPAYSVLDLSRTEALLGPMPDWRENLASVVGRLEG
jgi:dTDP-4-dehydrorhamnose reductase